jgi:hypothetical protein
MSDSWKMYLLNQGQTKDFLQESFLLSAEWRKKNILLKIEFKSLIIYVDISVYLKVGYIV